MAEASAPKAPNLSAPGDRVYNEYGQAATYIAHLPGHGHAVQEIFIDEEFEEPFGGQITIWKKVFRTEPVPLYSDRIAELDQTIEQKQQELCTLTQQIAEVQSAHAALLKDINSKPDLADLGLWLEGKITHLVCLDGSDLRIGTVKEILETREDDSTVVRLLSLMVDPKANKYWTARSAYKDGSGSWHHVLLATSEEDAKHKAQAYFDSREARERRNWNTSMAESALKLGLVIADAEQQKINAQKAAARASQIEQARKKLKMAQELLETLEGQNAQ